MSFLRKKDPFSFYRTTKTKIKRHNSIQATDLFFPFWNWYSCRERGGGGRWRTARAGKSCVKPLATADLFNPAVHEWSIQIGIYRRGKDLPRFSNNFCSPTLLDLMRGSVGEEHLGEMDSPLCGASMALLSGSGGMQRSRNSGCSLP